MATNGSQCYADQVDRHPGADHTPMHDNACPEVPDLRQPAHP
jgi:hypothetical protein